MGYRLRQLLMCIKNSLEKCTIAHFILQGLIRDLLVAVKQIFPNFSFNPDRMFLIRSLGGIGLPGDNPFIVPSNGRIPFSTPHSAYVASIAITMCQIKKRVLNQLLPEHFDRAHINGIRNLIEYSDSLDKLNKCVLPVDDYNLHATLSDIINKLKPGFIIMRTQNQIQHKLWTINQSWLHKTILSSMPKPARHHANDDKYFLIEKLLARCYLIPQWT